MLKKWIFSVCLLGFNFIVAGCEVHGDVGSVLDTYHECGRFKSGSQEYMDCLERMNKHRTMRDY